MKEKNNTLSLDNIISFLDNANLSFNKFVTLREKNNLVFDFDDDEFSELKNNLLSSLDEYLKYIILLHQYNEYKDKFSGFIYEKDGLDYLIKNDIIKPFVIDELDKFDEVNYEFYFRFIYLVFEKDYKNMEIVRKNNLSIDFSKKKFKDINISKIEKYFLITNNFDKQRLEELLTEEETEKYLSLLMEVISEVNDNNSRISGLERKLSKINEDNLDDLYEFVKGIKNYCHFIKENDYSFKFNIKEKCYLFNLINLADVLDKTEKEINEIIELFDINIIPFALKNTLSIKDLKKYKSLELNNNLLEFLFVNNMPYDNYIYLKNKDFNDEMIIKVININGNDNNNYEVNKKYFNLLPYLKKKVIDCLDDKTGNYLLKKRDEFIELFQGKNYEEYYYGFIKLLQTKTIREYSDILKYMDLEQLKIYDNISRYLNTSRKMISEDIVNNVFDNINLFEEEKDILIKIPVMLDANNNQIILDLLVQNGLNKEKMKYLDGTIFCYPNEFVFKVFKILKNNNVDIIINNKLNSNVIKYITQLIQNQTNYEFPPVIIYRPEKYLKQK